MQFSTEQTPSYTLVKLSGRLDTRTAEALQAGLVTLIHQNAPAIIIDSCQVTYLSSAGMRAFFVATKEAEKTKCKIAFFGFSESVTDLLRVARVDKYLKTFRDRTEAEQSLTA